MADQRHSLLETLASGVPDDGSAGPLYVRLKDLIAEQIISGRLSEGEQLPSERELMMCFGTSRVTARRALVALAEDGLIRARPGRGWFVDGGPISEPPNVVMSFTAMARQRGLRPTAIVRHQLVRPATLDEAELFQVSPGSELFDLERVRFLDDLPVCVQHCLLPLLKAPALADTDFATASVYEVLLKEARLAPTRADCTLEATEAGSIVGELLGVDPHSPVLVARQLTVDQGNQPIERSQVIYRGDRYRFRAIVGTPLA